MPIEIKELVIRAVVDSATTSPKTTHSSNETTTDKDALIEACVKEVLRILKAREDR